MLPSLPALLSMVKFWRVTAGIPVMSASMGMSTLSALQEPGSPDGLQLPSSPHDVASSMPVQVKDVPEHRGAVTGVADAGPAARTPMAQAAQSASNPAHNRRDIRR